MIYVVISTVLSCLLQDAHLHMITSALYISSQELRMAVPSIQDLVVTTDCRCSLHIKAPRDCFE